MVLAVIPCCAPKVLLMSGYSATAPLLQEGDVAPVGMENPVASSDFLILADHAGNAVPLSLTGFGVAQADLDRHIGIDIGILGVCRHLARRLDASLIHQRYSRLVIDCNRPPTAASSMPRISDGTLIPGNQSLSESDRHARIEAIFMPYHLAIRGMIEARLEAGRPPVIIAMHSFTPRHGDYPAPRPWQAGVLFNRDERLSRPMIACLQGEPELHVGINQPYAITEGGDYAVPVHCEARGLLHVALEIRQDLIADVAGQAYWAERLARLVPQALSMAQNSEAAHWAASA
jgi:predicted N-formylglutamate amidohydrolase